MKRTTPKGKFKYRQRDPATLFERAGIKAPAVVTKQPSRPTPRKAPPRLNVACIGRLVDELEALDEAREEFERQTRRVQRLLDAEKLCQGLVGEFMRNGGGDTEAFKSWLRHGPHQRH